MIVIWLNLKLCYVFYRMYGNTVEGELWAALDSAAQEDSVQLPADIKTIMNSWTLKMGFPVVTIVRNYSSQTAVATQVLLQSVITE